MHMMKPTLYHIPVCPFSQRFEILLELKGLRSAVNFSVVDITTNGMVIIEMIANGGAIIHVMTSAPITVSSCCTMGNVWVTNDPIEWAW